MAWEEAQMLSHYNEGKLSCWAGKSSAAVETESAFTCKIPRNGEGWLWGHLPQQFAASRYHHQKPGVRKGKILQMQAEHRPDCAGCPFPEAKLETCKVKTSGGFWWSERCGGCERCTR
ncbi:hypothetical protein Nmel_013964 [Mimus melanotis]